ncbi:MAG: CocE/NonD family hydrolase [Candidatus Obscuribacterales bacterium]|nr:CocE/NonD family hydrolase [Candidatus Obscuribacterales bacterium]
MHAPSWTLPEQQTFRVIENEWIPLEEGTKLGARIWLPEGAEQKPVPVVLEYLPYRKRDDLRWRDDATALNLAPYGIAFARVDIRGTGDSGGVMTDEYAEPELKDGVECIAWLARQPWCTGAVGMRGISWGGINTLQIAAMAPPALKAIMPMGCADNRFTGDAHYIGGALAAENFTWGSYFKVIMAAPPDPEISGENWEEIWQERLDATPALLREWTSHQRYDEYWQRGSVATDYSLIKCPVYVVSGWLDPYSSMVADLLAGLKVPRKALIGPWGHLMPNLPKPMSLAWAHEEVRWWQKWLLDVETGIMDEPMFRSFLAYETLSQVHPLEIPGRWVADDSWPSVNIKGHELNLGDGTLAPDMVPVSFLTHVGDKIVGMCKPQWMPSLPPDQTPDDLKSLVFDSKSLEADIEILGVPVAKIRVSANVPVAKLVVRLNEVLPDGQSWLVSYGVLNLTHRDSHEHPQPLTAGIFYDVEVPLYMVAHRFKKGSKIRAAISETLWPLVWPSPEIATLTIALGHSSLILPVRDAVEDPVFSIPIIHSAGVSHYFHSENSSGTSVKFKSPLERKRIYDIGTILESQSTQTFVIKEGLPNSGLWVQQNTSAWKRGDWNCTVSADYELTSSTEEFQLKEVLRAKKDDEEIFRREQISTIKRDLL